MIKNDLPQKRIDFLKKDYNRGFVRYCQIQADIVKHGFFQAKVKIKRHHRQQDGFIHAGIMATMADHTAGYSAFTIVPEQFQILTIEFKINFLKPAFGDILVCRSRVIREGRHVIVSESEVFDNRDNDEILVAKALVTLMAVHREKITHFK